MLYDLSQCCQTVLENSDCSRSAFADHTLSVLNHATIPQKLPWGKSKIGGTIVVQYLLMDTKVLHSYNFDISTNILL